MFFITEIDEKLNAKPTPILAINITVGTKIAEIRIDFKLYFLYFRS